MLYERGQATDCVKGICGFSDLRRLADDVCGPSPSPLTDDELRKVFASVIPVVALFDPPSVDVEEIRLANLKLLRSIIWSAASIVWSGEKL